MSLRITEYHEQRGIQVGMATLISSDKLFLTTAGTRSASPSVALADHVQLRLDLQNRTG